MLTDLLIKNFAIIDNLHVMFQPGLNMLTGETGAGKSIIIDAVNLILGGRASADLVRNGEDEAVVEAVFDISGNASLAAMLDEIGVDTDGELLVRRLISRSGKNRVFIGGGLSTLAILSEISRELVNIYGQHEAQTLLRPENHLTLLDGFGRLTPLRREYAALFGRYQHVRDEIRQLEEGERDAAQRIDLLSFQSREIADASPVAGEEEELLRERELLAHAEKLHQHSRGAYESLYGSEPSILGQLSGVKAAVAEIAAIDVSVSQMRDALETSLIQLEDCALFLRDYSARVELDPARLREIEDRLDRIQRIRKKYGPTIEEVIDYKVRIDDELDRLLGRERNREELDAALRELSAEVQRLGVELTEKRKQAAVTMKEAMERELRELAMPNAVLEVAFESFDEPKGAGMERIEFLFSPNPGEPPKPLSRIASGGELSRLMLALKQIHPESDVPTLIFDEVDTGISGATSALVGRKLKNVSRGQQVLCITHLPQVAAFADHHYRVEKLTDGGRTVTRMGEVAGETRVAEMARLLGGVKITDKTLEHAREMIAEAGKDQ
ncbi:MAG: DNA repair protein RecN [Geobacter sp.]|nr:DNA repair protein RecN [Geobacter sp.]